MLSQVGSVIAMINTGGEDAPAVATPAAIVSSNNTSRPSNTNHNSNQLPAISPVASTNGAGAVFIHHL